MGFEDVELPLEVHVRRNLQSVYRQAFGMMCFLHPAEACLYNAEPFVLSDVELLMALRTFSSLLKLNK